MYLRTVSRDTIVKIKLQTARSNLAPINGQTIPVLELCGAQLLSKLLLQSARDLDIPMDSVYAWSDSALVLRFPQSTRHNQQDPFSNWRYVNANHNPADLMSRGISLEDSLQNNMW